MQFETEPHVHPKYGPSIHTAGCSSRTSMVCIWALKGFLHAYFGVHVRSIWELPIIQGPNIDSYRPQVVGLLL